METGQGMKMPAEEGEAGELQGLLLSTERREEIAGWADCGIGLLDCLGEEE